VFASKTACLGGLFPAVWGGVFAAARVLVADDDPEWLEVVAGALASLGARVTLAESGAELIEHLAADGPFDLVVTDISMPWMTGVRAMHAARTTGLGTPVIVMTALRDPQIPARVAALGHNAALLHKPFALADLEALASGLLAPRGRQLASQAPHDGR
jgi:CheY-like chemotaxis protein